MKMKLDTKEDKKKKHKGKHLPKRDPIDKIKLQNQTATSGGPASYFKAKLDRHKERIRHHEEMADQGVHTEYHEQRAMELRGEAAKITAKLKRHKKPVEKDIGPMGSVTSATGAF